MLPIIEGSSRPSSQALLIAGEAATRLERYRDALRYYGEIPPTDAAEFEQALLAAAEIHRVHGSLDEAERLLNSLLEKQPSNVLVAQRLAGVLMMTGRPRAAQPLLQQLLELNQFGLQELQWLAVPDRPLAAESYLEQSLRFDSEQMFPKLGLATLKLTQGDFTTAFQLLEPLRAKRPDHAEIEAGYGRALWGLQDLPRLTAWLCGLKPELQRLPEACYLRGLLAEQQKQNEQASRAFIDSVLLDPNRADAINSASRALAALKLDEALVPLLEKRHRWLVELESLATSTKTGPPTEATIRRLVIVLEALDRPWEAHGWMTLFVRSSGDATGFADVVPRLQSQIRNNAARATPLQTALAAVATTLPPVDWNIAMPQSPTQDATLRGTPAFRDEAQAARLEFTFFEDPDPSTEGRRMHESMGGGVAAFDYDVDGWPDLYFTQGAVLNGDSTSTVYLDQLFRNTGEGHFDNVTSASAIVEPAFSQGIAAGDVNNDGFPDLYVANIGPNRLFFNQGDGTFRSALEAFTPADVWTASCAMADLNGDAIPDLFDVNYLGGPDVFEKRCRTPAGPRTCVPSAFAAIPDRLLLGNGDGTFRDASSEVRLDNSPGRGLGILIGDLANANGRDVFVANDTEANTLYRNPAAPSGTLVWDDIGQTAGVAFSYDGKPQASMGIAADDFDGNGLLDLFVTNYANESNSLYLQNPAGVFADHCSSSGLLLPSWPMLGFGTQSIDVELDGFPDLVVVNGDLDDFTHLGRPLPMRPQLFRNGGEARFTEWQSSEPNDFFAVQSQHRGRGLARLDWNRDGLDDFAVSQLDEPVALVTNRSTAVGASLRLTLIGTASARDAIGAKIIVEIEGHTSPRCAWVLAGDGYMCRNEQTLSITVPNADAACSVTVTWPSGVTSKMSEISARSEWVIREGQHATPRQRPK
ncbi:MAG TPA: FG-GAP-like repeat-containing protein [Planctomycetaceae bacterium]|nr:FG-GAP-like repeat-containing protein [Planctomycetaceae bacterium]